MVPIVGKWIQDNVECISCHLERYMLIITGLLSNSYIFVIGLEIEKKIEESPEPNSPIDLHSP